MAETGKIELSTLLPQTTPDQIKYLCETAKAKDIGRVCVSPYFVSNCRRLFDSTDGKIVSCIGFPYGFSITSSKVEEIKRVINSGADELDMVLNVSAIKSKNTAYLKNDIDSCIRISHLHGRPLSVALKMDLLSEAEIKEVCVICDAYEIDFMNMHFDNLWDIKQIHLVKNIVTNSKLKITGAIKQESIKELIKEVDLVSTWDF